MMTREEALERASETLVGLKGESEQIISVSHATLTVEYANALIAYAAELRWSTPSRPSWTCPNCAAEFDSPEAYASHWITNHKQPERLPS